MNLPAMSCTAIDSRPDGLMDDSMTHWRCRLMFKGRAMTVYYSMGSAYHGKEPQALEVLGSLFSDAACAPGTFADFCADTGYDEDSRKAEKIFKNCQSVSVRLRKLLGGAFDALEKHVRDAGY